MGDPMGLSRLWMTMWHDEVGNRSYLPLYVRCTTPNNGLDSYVENSRFERLPNDGQPKCWATLKGKHHDTILRN